MNAKTVGYQKIIKLRVLLKPKYKAFLYKREIYLSVKTWCRDFILFTFRNLLRKKRE